MHPSTILLYLNLSHIKEMSIQHIMHLKYNMKYLAMQMSRKWC